MPESTSVDTLDVLQWLGFTPDTSGKALGRSYEYDFGNVILKAGLMMAMPSFREMVVFSCTIVSAREIGMVDFQIPPTVESWELCVAWMVSFLDKSAPGRVFQPLRDTFWLQVGRDNKHLLPWEKMLAAHKREREQEREEYARRPHCTVRRDMLRLALKSLREHLEYSDDSEPVRFDFDGKVLSITCAVNKSERSGRTIVVAAERGEPWPAEFLIPAGGLRELPKRLMRPEVDVSVRGSRLTIDRWDCEGVAGTTRNTDSDATP